MNRIARKSGLAALALTMSLGMAACGGSDEADTASDETTSSPSETMSEEETPMEEESSEAMGAADGTFEPVATAASANPLLSTLVTAVTEAGLVDTLNSAENITVFAPTNDAFAEIPEKDLNALLKDKEALTAVLTHHVVPETLTPDNLAGTFETLNKDELVVEGEGEMFTADTEEQANIICGNIQTANATVYVVDTVMMP